MAIWYTDGAMGLLFDLNRHVLRTGRRAFVEIRRYGAVGDAIRRLRYETLTAPEALRLAEFIWAELLARARKQRISLPEFGRQSPGSL